LALEARSEAESWATEGSQQDYLHFWVQTRTSDDPTAHQYSPQLLPVLATWNIRSKIERL